MTTSMSPASPDAPPRRRSSASTVVFAIVAIGAVVAGIFAGREIALEQSRGMFLAGAVPMFLLAIVVVGLGLVGLVGLGVRRGRLNVAIGTLFATAGLLAGGAVVGWASAGATGGTGSTGPAGGPTGANAGSGQTNAGAVNSGPVNAANPAGTQAGPGVNGPACT